ncbi:MAG: A/G-specific adenine glycosylase, partial [Allosphingosinicella sp.]
AITYLEALTRRWPNVEALAAAPEADVMAAWAGQGYYARARNHISCARKVTGDLGGAFPDTEEGLRALPGIGRYTAAAIAAIAFGRRAVVVDANVERVVSRLFAIEAPLPGSRSEIHRLADTLTPAQGAGDFAQAMMDLGSAICTPRAPDCPRCPIAFACRACSLGKPQLYPVKAKKAARPRRSGTAYWLEHDGHVLLVRRPPSGLLGGMLALPEAAPPAEAEWREAGSVDHVFTHFALTMRLLCAVAKARQDGIWWPVDRLAEAGLPTLFARLAARGREWRDIPPLPFREREGPAAAGGGRVREYFPTNTPSPSRPSAEPLFLPQGERG